MTPESRKTIDDATHEEWVEVSQNMKMEITKEWCDKSAKIEGDAAVGAGLPSALGLPKLAAQSGALARATCSLPVSLVEDVATLMQDCAPQVTQWQAQWLVSLSAKLRAHAARATERQPEENR